MRHILLLVRLIIICVVLSIIFGGGYIFLLRSNIPKQYEAGKGADVIARGLQKAVKRSAWANTGVIRWSLLGNQHLWDLRRGLVRTRFSDRQAEHEALFDVDFKRYVVRSKANSGPKANRWVTLSESEAAPIAQQAKHYWLRDRFILEPSQSLFDHGVERYSVKVGKDKKSLLVHYRKGGEHPGDTFLWSIDDNGLPSGIKVWSEQLLVSGLEIKMDKWRILKTGLKVSTKRMIGPVEIDIKVSSAMSLTHLIGRLDPFKGIEGDPFDPPPTSQPNVNLEQAKQY